MKVIIIGGGPAGMMAAINAAKNNSDVTLIEKMSMLGRKLLITGKGRCNVTNGIDISEFINNIPGNHTFLYSALYSYTNTDLINFFESNGLKLKEERGNRIFPSTDKSVDVLNVLKKELKKENVKVLTNSKVKQIILDELSEEKKVSGVKLDSGEIIFADKVILATGGKSYPATGSTGDGYKIAQELGHTITKIRPSLVPLEIKDTNLCKTLQGLSLKNVSIKILDITKQKTIYEDFGEMIFTHFGVSGPIILSASAHLIRYKNIDNLLNECKIKLVIDFKPALSEEKLNLRIIRDFEEISNKEFKNSLNKLLPNALIPVIISKVCIDDKKKIHQITKEERMRLVGILKNFEITIKDFRPIEEAIITAGGINTKEINPSTMESKIVKGLYFAGEIIDVDAYTGGFNLQIAFSTGYIAGDDKS